MSKITQQDIADALGVSVVTVSNALAGKRGVSEALRDDILRKADELGFHSGRKKPRVMDNYTIGIFVSGWYISVGTSFYWEMYQKTAYAASRRNCFTILEISDKHQKEEYPRLLKGDRKIDGLIIIGRIRKESLKKIVETATVPVVLLDFNDPFIGCDSVLSDNYSGMFRATECLVDAGHRQIGFLGSFKDYTNGMERFFGYRKCLMERGIEYDPAFTFSEKFTPSGDPYIEVSEHLPTAIACSSDYLSFILVEALLKKGIRVPEDISIASFDHYLPKKLYFGDLTTYEVDMDKMARTAVKRLIRRMRGDTEPPVTQSVEGRIVQGDSIRRIRGRVDRERP